MDDQPLPRGSVPAGLGLGCLFQIGVIILLSGIGSVLSGKAGDHLVEFIALIQLIPFIPAILYFRKTGRTGTVQGLIIQAGIGVLIGGICGVLISGLGNMH